MNNKYYWIIGIVILVLIGLWYYISTSICPFEYGVWEEYGKQNTTKTECDMLQKEHLQGYSEFEYKWENEKCWAKIIMCYP